MNEQKSFKERVKDSMIENAQLYKEHFVDYEYLICSEAFNNRKYYIVDGKEDNYQHLTGVNSNVGAGKFFEKCYNATLTEKDFNFLKNNHSEKEVKGSVRRKINLFSCISNIFNTTTMVEEDFVKNKIYCTFAIGNKNCTLGFTLQNKSRPMTLLKGNNLHDDKTKNIELVLRKKNGEEKYNEILAGDAIAFQRYLPDIKELVSDNLMAKYIDNNKSA